jgi:hypothetical protein
MKINIDLDDEDITRLWVNSMEWKKHQWARHDGIFDPYIRTQPIEWSYRYVYFFEDFLSMLLMREYLKAAGWSFQVLTDESCDENGKPSNTPYLLTTDYGYTWEKV